MSVSIDKDPAEEGEDVRSVLASWLDDYASGRCDRDDMQESFLSVCRSNPEAPWDALALLDQYQRRGRIDTALARALKSDIAQLVFGVAHQSEPPRAATGNEMAASGDGVIDATGSRWRKLLAERDPESINGPHTEDVPTREVSNAAAERTLAGPAVARREVEEPAAGPRSTESGKFEPRQVSQSRSDAGAPARSPSMRRPEPQRPEPQRPELRREPSRPPVRRAARDVLRDRYELISILGRGSSGTVYKALDRHRSHLSEAARCVAVKVLDLNYDERPDALAELEREFHQAQLLSHPNIVSVFDLDRDAETYFVVMELLEGERLSDVLHRLGGRPMPREHAITIIGAIGAALTYAHRRDIVHGDLRPGHVMITGHGEIRVLDFGFSRNRLLELHSASAPMEPATPAPAYASVERVNGSEPRPSDDVYSLACIAYELLSGQHPFGGRSAVLARAHGRRPRRIRGLTRRQSQVLQRALLWTRGERRVDMHELLAALECTEGPRAPVFPEQLVAAPGASWRRRVIGMALFVVLACAAAAFVYFRFELPSIPPGALIELTDGPPAHPALERTGPAGDEPTSTDGEDLERAGRPPEPAAAPPAARADVQDAGRQVREQGANHEQPPAAQGRRAEPDATAAGVATSGAREPAPRAARPEPGQDAQPQARTQARAATGPVSIELDRDSYVANESDGAVRLTVRRSGPTRQAVSFRWTLRGNSAEAGSDFANIGPGLERIPAGVREAFITVPLVSDAIIENTELFLVQIEPAQDGLVLGERSSASVIIVDDD